MPGYTTERSSAWERESETTPAARVDRAGGATDVRLQREEADGGDAEVAEVRGGFFGGDVGAGGWVGGREETYGRRRGCGACR